MQDDNNQVFSANTTLHHTKPTENITPTGVRLSPLAKSDKRVRQIIQNEPKRLVIASPMSERFLGFSIGLLLAFGCFYAVGATLHTDKENALSIVIFASLGGLACVVFALVSLFRRKTAIFDKSFGWFWQGSAHQTNVAKIASLRHCCQLSHIIGLQLLEVYMGDSDEGENKPRRQTVSSYSCTACTNALGTELSLTRRYLWEINIVLSDNNRINVMRKDSKNEAIADIHELSRFLSVPVFPYACSEANKKSTQ